LYIFELLIAVFDNGPQYTINFIIINNLLENYCFNEISYAFKDVTFIL